MKATQSAVLSGVGLMAFVETSKVQQQAGGEGTQIEGLTASHISPVTVPLEGPFVLSRRGTSEGIAKQSHVQSTNHAVGSIKPAGT